MGILDFLFKRKKETKQDIGTTILEQEKALEITEQDTTKTEQPIDDKAYEAVERLINMFIEDINWPELKFVRPDLNTLSMIGDYRTLDVYIPDFGRLKSETLHLINGSGDKNKTYPINISSKEDTEILRDILREKKYQYAVWIKEQDNYYVDYDETEEFPSFDKHTVEGRIHYLPSCNKVILTSSLDVFNYYKKEFSKKLDYLFVGAKDGKVLDLSYGVERYCPPDNNDDKELTL